MKSLLKHLLFWLAAFLFFMGIVEYFFPDVSFSLQTLLESSHPDLYKSAHWISIAEGVLSLGFLAFGFKIDQKLAHQYLETFLRFGIGGMFLLAAWGKIADPKNFASTVTQYRFMPEFSVNFFSLFLPVLEFITGFLLIFGNRTKENSRIIFVLFIMFLIALGQAIWRDLGILCGCFPGLEDGMDKTEAWVSFIRDIILLTPTWYLTTRKNKFLWQIWFFKS